MSNHQQIPSGNDGTSLLKLSSFFKNKQEASSKSKLALNEYSSRSASQLQTHDSEAAVDDGNKLSARLYNKMHINMNRRTKNTIDQSKMSNQSSYAYDPKYMKNILNKELNSNQLKVNQLQPQKRYFNLNSKREVLYEKLPAFTNRVANSDRTSVERPGKARISVLKKSARQNA